MHSWNAMSLLMMIMVAIQLTLLNAFVPSRSLSRSLWKPNPVVITPRRQDTTSLYFFLRKKEEKKEESKEDEAADGETKEDTSSRSNNNRPFFANFLDRKAEKPKQVEQATRTVTLEEETRESPKQEVPRQEMPKEAEKPKEETAMSKALALKAQAERIRLEADLLDAQLTLDKIAKLETQLKTARAKGEAVDDLQNQMDALLAKMRGEKPKPIILTAPTKTDTAPLAKTAMTTTTTYDKPMNPEVFQRYLREFEDAPDFSKILMASMVGLNTGGVADINATEVALRMEMKERSDYSFLNMPKPTFTEDEIEKVKKSPLFKLQTVGTELTEDEVARKILEDDYYVSLLAEQTGDKLTESLSEMVDEGTDKKGFLSMMRSTINMTELETLTEAIFPESCRKEGQTPTMAQAMTLVREVLPKASFSPSGTPESVPGGFIIRGTSKLDNNDEFIAKIDAALEKSSVRGKLSVFYIKDYTIFMEPTADSVDLDLNPLSIPPILLVTGPDIAHEPRRLLLTLVSALGIGTSWYLSIYPFLLNQDLMKRAEEQMSLADANMAYDMSWLTDLSLPLFATFMGIQIAHELGHRAVAAAYKMNISLPTFVPSIVTGMTTTVTSFKSPPKNREAMFDFAIAGPLVGIVASLTALFLGLQLTVFTDAASYAQFPALPLEILRQSSLGGGIIEFVLGSGALSIPDGAAGTEAIASMNIALHPVAIAGFIGLIVNALSLLPIGTTDGGRIGMTLFGREAKLSVGQVVLLGLLLVGLFSNDLYLFYFSFLIFFQQGNDIPARNEADDVSFSRVLLAIVSGVIVLLTLIPLP